ncbi:DUF559 domain-containing protein [Nocardia yunnanensis]|uniref:DUF559 domain-containing protein n=1 Tax=Nocardia yunnanensis TaxID=2382165 RepID=A0A386ZEU2_9NOCA|nr:DUF559 domain-containing protein [Nocardia yunnanensis]AYF75135.1 DUF559 domain-containing protein [Nocardia yunnanensis]
MIRTRGELLAEGIPASTINYRCRSGTYIRLLPGTICLGPPTGLDRCHAVVAWQPSAVLSHRTAAWLHGFLPEEPVCVEATIPKSAARATPPWLHLHRRQLRPDWIDERYDLPVTTAVLTVFDCASALLEREADEMIDLHVGKHVSGQALLELCGSGLHGSNTVRRQLREAATHAASEPERLFARALARRGVHLLPNHPVGPFVCDFVDERSRTIIEIDGREFHSDSSTFRRDRRRQNALLLGGYLVLRYAAADIYQSLDQCADEAAAVIRERRR